MIIAELKSVEWVETGENHFAESTFTIEKVYKGDYAAGDEITVRRRGKDCMRMFSEIDAGTSLQGNEGSG